MSELKKAKHNLLGETKGVRELTNPGKIALADADTIAYAVCSVCEYGDDEAGYQIDADYALQTAKDKIQGILEATGCESIELHFTMGKNFRFIVSSDYKSNRGGTRTPEGLSELKRTLFTEYPGSKIHTDIEADDYVVWKKKTNPDKYVLVAVDKDVLHSVAGKHYNYYQNEKYGISPKWIEIKETMTLPWFYLQVLMGDNGDGVQGLPKCGPNAAFLTLAPELKGKLDVLKKAHKAETGKAPSDLLKFVIKHGLLDEVIQDDRQLYERVLKAYTTAGYTEKDVIRTARLVSMHQLDNEGKLSLWLSPEEK